MASKIPGAEASSSVASNPVTQSAAGHGHWATGLSLEVQDLEAPGAFSLAQSTGPHSSPQPKGKAGFCPASGQSPFQGSPIGSQSGFQAC